MLAFYILVTVNGSAVFGLFILCSQVTDSLSFSFVRQISEKVALLIGTGSEFSIIRDEVVPTIINKSTKISSNKRTHNAPNFTAI